MAEKLQAWICKKYGDGTTVTASSQEYLGDKITNPDILPVTVTRYYLGTNRDYVSIGSYSFILDYGPSPAVIRDASAVLDISFPWGASGWYTFPCSGNPNGAFKSETVTIAFRSSNDPSYVPGDTYYIAILSCCKDASGEAVGAQIGFERSKS
jgi:hypothetical protein